MTISHLRRITVIFFEVSKRPAELETAGRASIVCVRAIEKPAKDLNILTLSQNFVNSFYFYTRRDFRPTSPHFP